MVQNENDDTSFMCMCMCMCMCMTQDEMGDLAVCGDAETFIEHEINLRTFEPGVSEFVGQMETHHKA